MFGTKELNSYISIVKSAINERKPMQRAIRPYSNVDAALAHINNHN